MGNFCSLGSKQMHGLLAPGKNLASKSETSFRTLWQLNYQKGFFDSNIAEKLANIAWCYKFYLNSTPQFLLKWGVTPEEIPSRSKSGDEATAQWRIWSYAKIKNRRRVGSYFIKPVRKSNIFLGKILCIYRNTYRTEVRDFPSKLKKKHLMRHSTYYSI